MKHYLDLIQISAKQHKKQNRMTRLCIVLAVFLVTVIFGMADMEIRSQMIQAVKSDGSWHAGFLVDEEQGALLKARPEVEHIARYGVLNYHLRDGYRIEGIETAVCGFDKELLEMFPAAELTEGAFPENTEEAVLNESAKTRLGVQVGDTVSMATPQGEMKQYHITGITKDTALEAEHDAFGMYLNTDGFSALRPEETKSAQEVVYYVEFRKFCNIQKAVREISAQFGLEEGQVRQNVKVLMLMFQSQDTYILQLYFVAAVLAALVVIAGIFMITASMNSNIARRTEFFGMMRCLGATGKQVIRFVRKEALSWCRTAIPAGIIAGICMVWILCGMLRCLSPGLFEGLPVFGVSYIAVAAGMIVGFVTVLLAARSPAKRAAKVSPLTAVSGNAGTVQAVKRTANTRIFKVDMALGVHHASGSKKNFLLVTGSFAFSIILFLAFGTAIDFMHHALTPLRASAPDLYIYKEDYTNQIPSGLGEVIRKYPGVKRAFGRGYAEFTIPGEGSTLIVISYDDQQFEWAKDSLIEGNLQDAIDGKGMLSVHREGNTFAAGSNVKVSTGGGEQETSIVGTLGDAVLDVQLNRDATDSQVQEIRKVMEQECGGSVAFSDKRIGNKETKGASYSMSVFLYGFLAVIALIGFFNIINNIAMSVSARMREYGAMRAIGMTVRQLNRMVLGETMTYTVFGVLLGCVIGLPLNRVLFQNLVTSRWGDEWSVPGWELLVIVFIMLGSVCLAIMGPVKQIKKMTVVDTISRE